jgi:hypothetical protein
MVTTYQDVIVRERRRSRVVLKKETVSLADKIQQFGKVLTLAMSNPLHEEAILKVEEATGCEARVLITTYTEIMRSIERQYQILRPGST